MGEGRRGNLMHDCDKSDGDEGKGRPCKEVLVIKSTFVNVRN